MTFRAHGPERISLPGKLRRLLAIVAIAIAFSTWAMLLPVPIANLIAHPGFQGWYGGSAAYTRAWQIGMCVLLASPFLLLIGAWALLSGHSSARSLLLAYAWSWLAGATALILLNSLFTLHPRTVYGARPLTGSQQFRFMAGRVANGVEESVFPLLTILFWRWPELRRNPRPGDEDVTLADPLDSRGAPLSVRLVRTLCIVGMVFGGVALAILFTSSGSRQLDILWRFPSSRSRWLDAGSVILRIASSVILFCGSAATLVRKGWGPTLLLIYPPIWIMAAVSTVVRGQFIYVYYNFPPWIFVFSDSARAVIVCAHAVFVFVCLRWPEMKPRVERAGGFQPIFGTLAVIPVSPEAAASGSAEVRCPESGQPVE